MQTLLLIERIGYELSHRSGGGGSGRWDDMDAESYEAAAARATADEERGSPWADSSSGVQSPSSVWPSTFTVLSSHAIGQVFGPGGVYCRKGGQSIVEDTDQLLFVFVCSHIHEQDAHHGMELPAVANFKIWNNLVT